MAVHVFANIVTPFGTAANNRGETEGNITTLQKVIWMGMPHTTISAEAIRFALRRLLAEQEPNGTNRTYNEATRANGWVDREFQAWAVDPKGNFVRPDVPHFIDDDLLGFMSAEAAKGEAEPAEDSPGAEEAGEGVSAKNEEKKKGKRKGAAKAKGTATVRRGVLEVTRAISLTPWPGDVTFNAASPRATSSAAKGEGDNPVPYGAEVHATRYQYGLAMTPARLRDPARASKALQALAALNTVAGNHSRFLYDFSPESIVLRITHDPAPRFLCCFETPDDGKTVDASILDQRVADGDIDPKELIFGGSFARSALAQKLQQKGATIPSPSGVLAAVQEAIRRLGTTSGGRG
jgi:CRISPR-associated protein Cst2